MRNSERNSILGAVLALAACACVLSGCIPQTVTLSLGEGGQRLSETTVHRDDGSPRDKIALVDLRGMIADAQGSTWGGSGAGTLDALAARLDLAARDRAVKAVVLHINSPGGSVTASDVVYREIQRFKEESGKPVVASLGEVAASGGYYAALAADEIVTMPTTITGSIGVIIPNVNVSEGLSMIGISSRPIVSGPNKAMGSPLSPEQAEHLALLQGMVDDFYAQFQGLVLERRPQIETQYVAEATDGRVMTGTRAVAIGLADTQGDVYDAFERAKSLAGIESAQFVKYHPRAYRPRSPYAFADVAPPSAENEPGVIRLEIGGGLQGLSPANAYYLWTPTVWAGN